MFVQASLGFGAETNSKYFHLLNCRVLILYSKGSLYEISLSTTLKLVFIARGTGVCFMMLGISFETDMFGTRLYLSRYHYQQLPGWLLFLDLNFSNSIFDQIGFDIATGGLTDATQVIILFSIAVIWRWTDFWQTTGAEAIIDADVSNTPIFIRTSQPSNGKLAGSIVLNNVYLKNVPVVVGVENGATVLHGSTGTMTIVAWAQGNVFHGTTTTPTFVQGNIPAPIKNPSLLNSNGKIVSRGHPQYEDLDVSSFVSARQYGAAGDGVTDDTKALQSIFNQVCN